MENYNLNNINRPKFNSTIKPKTLPQQNSSNQTTTLTDKFIKENKKSGLIERFYNYCKNKTGFGIGSNKVKQAIADSESGKISQEEAKKKFLDYKISQENSAQSVGDVASSMAGISVLYKSLNFIKTTQAQNKINALPQILNNSIFGNCSKIATSPFSKLAIIPLAMIAAGATKSILLKLNNIVTPNPEKKELKQLKKEFKQEKKLNPDCTNDFDESETLRKIKFKELEIKESKYKNFKTGAINGLFAPITAVAGGIVGIPAFILATTGVRYCSNKKDTRKKSFSHFVENLKNNYVLNSLCAVAIAIPTFKKINYSKILSKNLTQVVNNLKGITLEKLSGSLSAREEIEHALMNSGKIADIRNNNFMDIDTKIKELTKENIFAVKMLQVGQYGELSATLKENCPPSRTIAQAQQEINKLISSDKYTVSKLLGVGTVAESYLAKDKSGKEVCIKILKDGINLQKVQKDKDTLINLIRQGVDLDKLSADKKYLIKNIENFAEGLSQEVDLENELKAAQRLKQYTKKANVVVPIEAKPGIYVMEKAPGISLETLTKYYNLNTQLTYAKTHNRTASIAHYSKLIEELKAKSPDFENFELSIDEIKTLLNKYGEVQTEQFLELVKGGKDIHADIHEGNIFIDPKALKNNKGNIFTLIDTGNTLHLSKEQIASSLKLTSLIENGNVKDITKYIIDGAVLPQNLSKEQALKLIEKELTTIFFDNKTKINPMNNDELFNVTNNILRKHNIVPSDNQFNLNKAKNAAALSLQSLRDSFINKECSEFKNLFSGFEIARDIADLAKKQKEREFIQRLKNIIGAKSFKEIINDWRNPNSLKTNSVKHLTYKFKQNIQNSEK